MSSRAIQQVSDAINTQRESANSAVQYTAKAVINAIDQRNKEHLLQLQGVHAAGGNNETANLIKAIIEQL